MKHINFVARKVKNLFGAKTSGYEVCIIDQTHTYTNFSKRGLAMGPYTHIFKASNDYVLYSGIATNPKRHVASSTYMRGDKCNFPHAIIKFRNSEYHRFKQAVEEYNEIFKE